MRDERLHGVTTKIHVMIPRFPRILSLNDFAISTLCPGVFHLSCATFKGRVCIIHLARKRHTRPSSARDAVGMTWPQGHESLPTVLVSFILLVRVEVPRKACIARDTLNTSLCQTNIINTVSIGHLPTSASAWTPQESRTWGCSSISTRDALTWLKIDGMTISYCGKHMSCCWWHQPASRPPIGLLPDQIAWSHQTPTPLGPNIRAPVVGHLGTQALVFSSRKKHAASTYLSYYCANKSWCALLFSAKHMLVPDINNDARSSWKTTKGKKYRYKF